MIRKEMNASGMDAMPARSAAVLVQVACKFAARIYIEQGSKVINAKSMMGVLSLGAGAQEPLFVVVDGEDEQEALAALEQLVETKFAPTELGA